MNTFSFFIFWICVAFNVLFLILGLDYLPCNWYCLLRVPCVSWIITKFTSCVEHVHPDEQPTGEAGKPSSWRTRTAEARWTFLFFLIATTLTSSSSWMLGHWGQCRVCSRWEPLCPTRNDGRTGSILRYPQYHILFKSNCDLVSSLLPKRHFFTIATQTNYPYCLNISNRLPYNSV